jgi:uncharacterized protein YbjT (DUF2867 family)
MKVAVIGAHSGVGEHVIKELMERDHQALAVVGNENQLEDLKLRGAADLAIFEQENMNSLLKGYETVIFLNGISPKSHTGKSILVDHDVVQNTIKEAERQGVRRFIMLSAIRANELEDDPTRGIANREAADKKLESSNMIFTIIRSGRLNDSPGKGKIHASSLLNDSEAEISRDDLAAVLVETIENESTYHKTFEVSSGETPILEAIASI